MRTLFLRLYYVYARIIAIFYFIGYFIWYWKKSENAYREILEKLETIIDERHRYSSKRYDEKILEKDKIAASSVVTIILLWILVAIISIEAALIFFVGALLLSLLILLILLVIYM